MRWHRKLLTLAALGALSTPQVVAADDVQTQLQQMQQRMNQLEDKLQATTDQLQATEKKSEEQQQVIDRAGLKDNKTGSSKIAAFLDTLTIGGWVSASYWYNANNPASGNLKNANTGGGANPFNPDANSFNFEQLWFELERPITPDARAGFRADIAFGQIASLLNQVNAGTNCSPTATGAVTAPTLVQTAPGAAPRPGNVVGPFPGGTVALASASAQNTARNTCNQSSSVYIDQAYVQYLIPWGDITFKAGQFGTLIGYEVPQAPYNWQLSRGLLFSLFQPINHVGILLSKTYDNGIDWGIGGVNGFGGPIGLNGGQNGPDNNESKSILLHAGLTGDIGGISIQGLWGPEATGNDHQTRTTIDFIAHAKPWDRGPEVALNADYAILNGSLPATINGVPTGQRPGGNQTPDAWGAALYARQAITDKLGISVRGEYAEDHYSFFCVQTGFFCTVVPITTGPLAGTFAQISPGAPLGFPNDRAKIYEFTGTIDYSITQQLITKVEIRWDALSNIDGVSTHGSFPVGYINNQSNGLFNYNHQLVAGAEILYKF
jgi:hypothetical protein